ncbi:MAG: hypothetical protein AAFZ15_11800 [Bacteroidota bacterium]
MKKSNFFSFAIIICLFIVTNVNSEVDAINYYTLPASENYHACMSVTEIHALQKDSMLAVMPAVTVGYVQAEATVMYSQDGTITSTGTGTEFMERADRNIILTGASKTCQQEFAAANVNRVRDNVQMGDGVRMGDPINGLTVGVDIQVGSVVPIKKIHETGIQRHYSPAGMVNTDVKEYYVTIETSVERFVPFVDSIYEGSLAYQREFPITGTDMRARESFDISEDIVELAQSTIHISGIDPAVGTCMQPQVNEGADSAIRRNS